MMKRAIKKHGSLVRLRKRWQVEQRRNALDTELLTKTHRGILRQISAMEAKHQARMSAKKTAPGKEYLGLLATLRRVMVRQYNYLIRIAKGIRETRNRLFQGCTPAETDNRLQALLRIPQTELRHFDRLDSSGQEQLLLRLMEQYGGGSGNGGYSESLLLIPGYVSASLVDEEKEADGSKRRPQFIHEIIDRLIYAALHPQQYKTLFFHKTRHQVQRWKDKVRQIRGEGRLAMVKVMIVLLPYLDRKSLRIGYYDGQTFFGIPRQKIAERAGISMDSVKTALSNLVEVGVLHAGKQPRESKVELDGIVSYKGLPVVRCLNKALFEHLGLDQRYMAESVGDRNALSLEALAVLEQFEDVHADKGSSVAERCMAEMKLALIGR